MRREDFSYDLPENLIAQTPLAERSASRLLVLDRQTGAVADRTVRDLPGFLRPGDLLVFNDTRVVAARLVGSKPTGGRVEIFLERALDANEALVQLSASKPIREGLEVATPGGKVRVLRREEALWRVELPGPPLEFFERWGEVPLPPYIHRPAENSDRERYQSIFARERGAVAAPTASLHFDEPLVREIQARGVERTFVTLHVGAGTFQPIRTDDLESHTMHTERVSVGAGACAAIECTRAAGGRVIAIGTTVARALESAALHSPVQQLEASLGELGAAGARVPHPRDVDAINRPSSLVAPWSGETRLFIRPGFRFQVIDGLLTNFHLPESTLLMLVCAFAGRQNALAAYEHAVRERYRFFSYGDAMFVTASPGIDPACG